MIRPRSLLAARILVVDAAAVAVEWVLDIAADTLVASVWWVDEKLRNR